MAKQKKHQPLDNVISDETGEFDQRFILWRHFCKLYNIPVESLPSQLNDEQRQNWEQLKDNRLRKR